MSVLFVLVRTVSVQWIINKSSSSSLKNNTKTLSKCSYCIFFSCPVCCPSCLSRPGWRQTAAHFDDILNYIFHRRESDQGRGANTVAA